MERADALALLFVFDDRLLGRSRHSPNRVRFLHDCVERLSADLEKRGQVLVVRRGDPQEWVPRVARSARADCVTFNRDTVPSAQRRDAVLTRVLEAAGHRVVTHKDHVVFESDEVLTGAGRPFSVYTPYRNAWWKQFSADPPEPSPARPFPPPIPKLERGELPSLTSMIGRDAAKLTLPTGGERAARRRLHSFLERSSEHYSERRNFPGVDGTSRLSPHLRFGTLSIRTCFRDAAEWCAEAPSAASGTQKWLDELVWREFYHSILEVHPRVLRGSFRAEYDALQWSDDEERFNAWCEGRTGFPLIDAAMRQLVTTGWMHNRARMVVASFLVKDLWIDWRWGERFFMQHLVDGDPANNNGGWQWSASTGTDAQPFFRIFNPVSQSERYDPEGTYIRRFVPELAHLDDRRIHRPWTTPLECPHYPPPIVDHRNAREHALRAYEAVRNAGADSERRR